MRLLLLCAALVLPSIGFADTCDILRLQSTAVAYELKNLHTKINRITLQIGMIENSPNIDYDQYIDVHLELHRLERDLIDKENLSFFVEIRRIRECGLPVTYTPKKRSKKV